MPETVIHFLRAIAPLGVASVHFFENVMNFKPILTLFREKVRKAFCGKVIVAGRYTKESAEEMLERRLVDLVVLGEPYIANPDLAYRLKYDLPLNQGERDTYYGGDEAGLNDYSVLDSKMFFGSNEALEMETFIKDYYLRFDRRDPFEVFSADFAWDEFVMRSPGRELSSKAEYQGFYEETCETYANSQHKLENFMLTKVSETGAEACCDITFSANTLAAPQKQILVKGKAIYRLVKGEERGWRIAEYLIEVN